MASRPAAFLRVCRVSTCPGRGVGGLGTLPHPSLSSLFGVVPAVVLRPTATAEAISDTPGAANTFCFVLHSVHSLLGGPVRWGWWALPLQLAGSLGLLCPDCKAEGWLMLFAWVCVTECVLLPYWLKLQSLLGDTTELKLNSKLLKIIYCSSSFRRDDGVKWWHGTASELRLAVRFVDTVADC